MKLNWFSPLPPAKSGIADYIFGLLPALKEQVDLVLWTTQSQWSEEIENYGKVVHYQGDRIPWQEINQADLNIYHIGNNSSFHQEIWEISRQCPGLVIVHDPKLQHFFISVYKESYRDRASYLSQMKRYYGRKGEQIASALWNGTVAIEFIVDDYPLTALALKNSVATITHNRQVYQDLQQDYNQLIAYIPLPYVSQSHLPAINLQKENSPYQLIIFGHLGNNRRLEPLLEALSTFPQQNSFKLDIYGELLHKDDILQRIEALNLNHLVNVRGFVSDNELDSALANADLAINLRYPTMGEASLSQLRILSHGLSSLVTRVGWYAQLPENTVVFVDPEREIADIHKHLQDFLDNPELYREIGHKGRQYVEKEHHPQAYVQSLLDIASQACSLRHRSLLDFLTDRVGKEISGWHLTNGSQSVLKNVAEAISFLVDEDFQALVTSHDKSSLTTVNDSAC